jgi:hypothetical protein
MKQYEAMAGEHISQAATAMVALAEQAGGPIEARFNDVCLLAMPGETTAADIEGFYNRFMEERRIAYENSPEGQAAAARQAAFQEWADRAAAEGLVPFAVRDEAAWQRWVDANTDPYGACILRYAARWANRMEAELAAGHRLEDIADATSSTADVEGITGFMYGAAVSVLASCWEHGEALRRWHNLKTQIRHEGEAANDSGGVLNPALLSIGPKDA